MSGENWREDELVLVLDAYLNRDANAYEEHEEVEELAEIMDRSRGAISYKMSNFRHINPEDDASGSENYGKLDEKVWKKYGDNKGKLAEAAEEIRLLHEGLRESNLLDHSIRKLGGTVEHWLTTYHRGFWGFSEEAKDDWEKVSTGDVFLLHASGQEYLSKSDTELRNMSTGIVGVGVVNGKSRKDEPVWVAELDGSGDWPLLIHFSEIYWFGDTENIEDKPVSAKNTDQRLKESKAMLENAISFGEMKDYSGGYQVSPYGGLQNIGSPEKIEGLVMERMKTSHIRTYDAAEKVELVPEQPQRVEDESDLVRSTPSVLDITWEDEGEKDYGTTSAQVKINKQAQQEATRTHQRTLKDFMSYLEGQGYSCVKTNLSDLIGEGENELILAEVKSIKPENYKKQIREALGQLFEYEYFDFIDRDWTRTEKLGFDSLNGVKIRKALVLSNNPPEQYIDYLKYMASEKEIEVFIREANGVFNNLD